MLTKINSLMEYFLIAIATYILLFTDYHFLLVIPLFPLFFFIKYMHRHNRKKKLGIPEYYFTLGLIAIYLAIAGEFFFEFYYKIEYYDKILHLTIPVYLIMVINFFLKKNVRFRTLFVVLTVLGLSSLWEMLEFVVDNLSKTTVMQGVFIDMKELTGGLTDTMKDMILAFIGSIIGVMIFNPSKK